MTCPQCQGEGAFFRGKTPIDACRMCASKAEAEWRAARRAVCISLADNHEHDAPHAHQIPAAGVAAANPETLS
ncbi:hypothetical protein WDZ11_14680 [Roseomonas mucosa]|uniref:hypothetical protein n=1 Tax=Roseomonas mucosa TaxID=207340 RepID=UPI0030CE03B5